MITNDNILFDGDDALKRIRRCRTKRFFLPAAAIGVALLLLFGCKTSKSDSRQSFDTHLSVAIIGGEAGVRIGQVMNSQKAELQIALPDLTAIESVNQGEALKVTLPSNRMFAANSSSLNETAKQMLHRLTAHLNKHDGTRVSIIGHTDNTGLDEFNRTLSERRAKSVCDLLISCGVDADRIAYEGMGMQLPAANNHTVEGRMLNRRIEIFILPGEAIIRQAIADALQAPKKKRAKK